MPLLRRLVACLSPRRPGFTPGTFHVGFVVYKVVLYRISPCSSDFPCQYHFNVALYSHTSSGRWTTNPLEAAVQRHSLTPSTWTTLTRYISQVFEPCIFITQSYEKQLVGLCIASLVRLCFGLQTNGYSQFHVLCYSLKYNYNIVELLKYILSFDIYFL
jgi:hypothetical protein